MKLSSMFGYILAAAVVATASAQTVIDRLNYSAAACIPRYAGAFQGSGSDGFQWEQDGSFRNHDGDDNEQLICAIPFDPALRRANGTIPAIEISVDVIDSHGEDEVRVDLFAQNGNVAATLRDSANTGNPEVGRRTMVVTMVPTASTRYIWIRIDVPDADNTGFSGVVGYRVRRLM